MFEHLPVTLVLAQSDAGPDDAGQTTSTPVATPAPTPGGDANQTGAATDGNGQPLPTPNNNGGGDPLGGLMSFLPFILIIVVFWFILWGSQRKEKKKRAQMLEALAKNDKVVTIGGVIGTVVEVKENEVVLKVDESSNTRMRFSRSAIQGIVADKED